ncbi:MAG: GldG family protein [Nitrospirota bacterium]|nr:GldG family protein [Nitrospirota bacterium]
MNRQRMALSLTRWGVVLVTGAILLVVNLLASGWFLRLDLTEDKEFTTSSSTRQLLEEMDDNLLVRGYFTRDLPPPYNRLQERVQDLLQEYRSLSDGKVNYEFVDPAEMGESAESQMMLQGIPQVQVTDVSSDQVQVKAGFMGIAVLFEDRREVIPVVQGTQGLEFLLTGKIRKLTGSGRGRIGMLTGFGAFDPDESLGRIADVVREQYDLVGIDLAGGGIPSDVAAVLVGAPKEPLSDQALAELDRYLGSGGSVGVFASRADVNLQNQFSQPIEDPFRGTLSSWGLALGDALVVDGKNMRITVAQRRGIFTMQNMVDYPFIPVVGDLDPNHPVVGGLEGIFLPFVSTVRSHDVEGVTHSVLARTSRNSWQLSPPYNVDPFQRMDALIVPGRAIRGPHPVVVAAEGVFPSHWAGRVVTGADGSETTIEPPLAAPGRLLVVGSGMLLDEQYLMNGENMPFLMNAIDWLAGDESLIALRSRGVTERPLREISDGTRALVKFCNMLLGPLLLVAVGLIFWRSRRARRARLGETS